VYVEQEAFEHLGRVSAKDGKAVSEYVRGLIDAALEMEADEIPGSNPGGEGGTLVSRKSETGGLKPPATKTCIHGTAKGNRCWQCGGKAKVE
jgi:hypothetical protein